MGYVHGDVKPENVLINSTTNIYLILIDYGFTLKIKETKIGKTPRYSPPESF